MYNSFVSLRKECLNGVLNMAADFSVSEATLLRSANISSGILLPAFSSKHTQINLLSVPQILRTMWRLFVTTYCLLKEHLWKTAAVFDNISLFFGLLFIQELR